jgi:hypothetical protein
MLLSCIFNICVYFMYFFNGKLLPWNTNEAQTTNSTPNAPRNAKHDEFDARCTKREHVTISELKLT